MLLDKETLFSDRQALAAGNSANVVQVQRGLGDYGIGDDVSLFVHTDTPLAAALTVTLQMAETAAMATPKTLGTYTAAVGAKGVVVASRIPAGATGKYLRLAYAGTGLTGLVTAGLVKDVPNR